MSNETKRDVLKKALDFFVMRGIEQSINYDLKRYQYLSDYDAALPDDLPVIPKAVSEVIKTNQADTELTIVLMRAKTGHQPDDYWINNHQDTFARAWLLGVWRVEETGEIVKLEDGE